MRYIPFLVLSLLAYISNAQTFTYDFDKPFATFILPDVLYEISGLTDIDSSKIACIQDELGLIFIYDLQEQSITKQFKFGEAGDYEGITYTGDALYILRSDGMIIECLMSEDYLNIQIDSFQTNIPAIDNEGLCFDPKHNRLLIGCKSKLGKGAEFKNLRAIYGFDLATKKLSDDPVFEINLNKIISFAEANNIKLPTSFKKKLNKEVPKIKIGISAIAIHPVTANMYVLSAVDHLMMIYDQHGEMIDLINLDKKQFQKAEGITFFETGELLISNEGKGMKPTLLRFNFQ